jgi:hypothetical protein
MSHLGPEGREVVGVAHQVQCWDREKEKEVEEWYRKMFLL